MMHLSNTPPRRMPPGVQQILAALTDSYVSRCARVGLRLEEFYAALIRERRERPLRRMHEVFAAAYRRAMAVIGN